MPDRLLDSNAIGAAMKAHPAFEHFLVRVGRQDGLSTSAVVEGEVRFGIARLAGGKKKRSLASALDQILKEMTEVLPITRKVASRYSKLKADLWARGKPMGENDLWIAATALVNRLILVTNDNSFKVVKGLRVEDWLMAPLTG